jgi:hypothetical protein
MKKFELKEAIKNEIKSVLSEDSLNEISSTEANAQLMEIVEHQKQILNILKELKKGADLDAAIRIIENEVGKTLTKVKNLKQIKGLQTTFADVREDREAEESDLDKVKAEIKKHLAIYQDAEGDMAKKSAVEMLKKLNVEKKRLEAEELENVSSIGMGQELDYDSED